MNYLLLTDAELETELAMLKLAGEGESYDAFIIQLRLAQLSGKKLVTVPRARQSGKTRMLAAMDQMLAESDQDVFLTAPPQYVKFYNHTLNYQHPVKVRGKKYDVILVDEVYTALSSEYGNKLQHHLKPDGIMFGMGTP